MAGTPEQAVIKAAQAWYEAVIKECEINQKPYVDGIEKDTARQAKENAELVLIRTLHVYNGNPAIVN